MTNQHSSSLVLEQAAQIWHIIHSFLELLRRYQQPDSLAHMTLFIFLVYPILALLIKSVPSSEMIWMECLGDLARYVMAIKEAGMRDREVWAGVARVWYDKAADRSPNVGRIQHHLAVLAKPNIAQQLFYYSKALVNVQPFPNARESIMSLFNPFLVNGETTSERYPPVEAAFVKVAAVQFTRGSIVMHTQLAEQFVLLLDSHIERTTVQFRVQGPEMAATLAASLFDFGNAESILSGLWIDFDSQDHAELEKYKASTDQKTITQASLEDEQRQAYFKSPKYLPQKRRTPPFQGLRMRLHMPVICSA